jgi:hypothetical protein
LRILPACQQAGVKVDEEIQFLLGKAVVPGRDAIGYMSVYLKLFFLVLQWPV